MSDFGARTIGGILGREIAWIGRTDSARAVRMAHLALLHAAAEPKMRSGLVTGLSRRETAGTVSPALDADASLPLGVPAERRAKGR